MFVGRYTHTIDAKGRLVVPQRLRELSAEGNTIKTWKRAIVTLAPERDSLHLYLEEDWNRMLMALTDRASVPGRDTMDFLRLAGGQTQPVECDQLGRILLPDDLRTLAALEREVLWVGATNRAEVWCPERWQAYMARSESKYVGLWDEKSRVGRVGAASSDASSAVPRETQTP